MDPQELKYWLAFSQMPQIGAARFKQLFIYFDSLQIAWQAGIDDFLKAGFDHKIAQQIIDRRKDFNPDFELEKLLKQNIKTKTFIEEGYPKNLAQIYNPPGLFYYQGNLDILSQPCLSVVGTRKITDYGKRVTADIVRQLVNSGLTIISGLAYGIDAWAHQTAIDCQGCTAAVLGSGLNKIYPMGNYRLAQEIIANNGCLISEYPIDMKALKHHFPVRNRIISGLSLGTLVTEAGLDSGALITTKYALDQNRQIFAVPGSIYNNSAKGPNTLIKLGAIPVLSADDILQALNIERVKQEQKVKRLIPDTPEEKLIIDKLSLEPTAIDKIVTLTKMDIKKVNSTLTLLEMKGLVKNLGGGNYVICK